MAQGNGRVTCPKCGANNFETVATCYRCGTALGQGGGATARPTAQSAPPLPPLSNSLSNLAPNNPVGSQIPAGSPGSYPPPGYAAPPLPRSDGDPRMARRAAILLAITIPFIGLPVGWAFMMMEDQRRQAIGRFCATWSMIALVFHLLLLFLGMASLASYLPTVLKTTQALSNSARNSGQGGN